MIDLPPALRREEAAGRHATTTVYLVIAAILVVVTVMEIGVFSIPEFGPVLVPVLLILSAVKFALVAMFYMHLRFDSRVFSGVFLLPLGLAVVVVVALLFLFGKFRL